MRMLTVLAIPALCLAACAEQTAGAADPQDVFFAQLSELCGQAFEGALTTADEADAGFANQRLVAHVRECSETEIRIPLHVGEDRSRTWVITRTESGLRLKHDHRHEDGSEDAVTQYGGDTDDMGSATRQAFPADQFSKELFVREGLDVSVDNVWAMEVRPGEIFAYELTRPGREFRAEFDLSAPVAPPPPPWGAE